MVQALDYCYGPTDKFYLSSEKDPTIDEGHRRIKTLFGAFKKFSRDENLTIKLITRLKRKYSAITLDQDRLERIVTDIGTPGAIACLRSYYQSNPEAHQRAHVHSFNYAKGYDNELLRVICQAGADINHLKIGGKNAFLFACEDASTTEAQLEFLLKLGADVNSTTAKGEDGLFVIANRNISPGVRMPPTVTDSDFLKAKLLLEYGIDVYHRNKQGRTAYFYAQMYGKERLLPLFLVAGLVQKLQEKKGNADDALDICTIFCFPVISGMELTFEQESAPVLAGSQDYFNVLPNDIKAQILAELYCSAGNKYVLRFLRTSKKYYGDPDLTYKFIYSMTHDFRGNMGERIMQIALDLGTPHAVSFLREYYKTNPAALACPNEHFFYQARDNNYRVSRILKLAGVDINAYRDASGDNAFLAARHIEYY